MVGLLETMLILYLVRSVTGYQAKRARSAPVKKDFYIKAFFGASDNSIR